MVNDHVLKRAWPGFVTGKLSDVAGLCFFPLFLVALTQLGKRLRGQPVTSSRKEVAIAVFATGAVFAAIQISAAAGTVYRFGLGALQWPLAAATELLQTQSLPALRPVALTPDVTDLLALPALWLPWRIATRRVAAHRSSSGKK